MKKFSEIVEQIKDIISFDKPNKRIFDKDIAKLLAITQVNFATMKKRDKIPFCELLDFCAARCISINWLLYDQLPESLIEASDRFYKVRFFDQISASAGGGALNDNEIYSYIDIDYTFLCKLGGLKELKYIDAIRVSGDSMEPTFVYDDTVFINRKMININKGGVFIINTEDGLLIKRLKRCFNDCVDIISDNREYQTQTVRLSQIDIVGRVVAKFALT